jgi:double-stranded uracil-DNA glycosylase
VPRKLSKPSPPNLPLLKDRIRPGVRVLLVGINPGVRSALTGHHFAGYSNRFWKLLVDSGLVPVPITYQDDDRLPEWGFGLTNLVPRPTRGIDELTAPEYLAGRRALERKIRRYAPRVVALIGLTLARSLLRETPRLVGTRGERLTPAVPPPSKPKERRDPASTPDIGLQSVLLAGAPVFVLPNPSGRNAHYSYSDMLDAFRELKAYVDALPRPSLADTSEDETGENA